MKQEREPRSFTSTDVFLNETGTGAPFVYEYRCLRAGDDGNRPSVGVTVSHAKHKCFTYVTFVVTCECIPSYLFVGVCEKLLYHMRNTGVSHATQFIFAYTTHIRHSHTALTYTDKRVRCDTLCVSHVKHCSMVITCENSTAAYVNSLCRLWNTHVSSAKPTCIVCETHMYRLRNNLSNHMYRLRDKYMYHLRNKHMYRMRKQHLWNIIFLSTSRFEQGTMWLVREWPYSHYNVLTTTRCQKILYNGILFRMRYICFGQIVKLW